MTTVSAATILDLLKTPDENNQTWIDLITVFNTIMEDNVESPIQQLEEIRQIIQGADQILLRRTARMLGFDVSQDILSLNQDVLTKLVTQLPLYHNQNGTEKFINFEELLLNSNIEIEYLYTQDYVNFYPEPGGGLLMDGTGEWFKTTHINIGVDLQKMEQIVLSSGQTLYSRVKSLFYNFSPIALVIERFYFIVTFKADFGIGAIMTNNMAYIILE